MNEDVGQLQAPRELIDLRFVYRKNARRFFSFLICVGILIASFAISGVWMRRDKFFESDDRSGASDVAQPEQSTDNISHHPDDPNVEAPEVKIPENAIPVISMDFSYGDRSLLQNQTAYTPNLEAVRGLFQSKPISTDAPTVLILHTHAQESYLMPDTKYIEGDLDRELYSKESGRSVVDVGRILCETLNQNGVPAVHCSEKHGTDGTLQNAYAHAEACIEAYLKKYPSIQYVIDLHRDGILDSNGALVRTHTDHQGEALAQVMAVVGTDGNGTSCPNWQQNLSLALCLYEGLETEVQRLCRPISLRNASYNQELAPYALLLEIGSAGNTQQEAVRTAKLVGKVLADLIQNG